MTHVHCFRRAAATLGLLLATASGGLYAQLADQPPLNISEQGSFAFGGKEIVGPDGRTLHCDHGYTEYQIPISKKARQLPIVMWHSTSTKVPLRRRPSRACRT